MLKKLETLKISKFSAKKNFKKIVSIFLFFFYNFFGLLINFLQKLLSEWAFISMTVKYAEVFFYQIFLSHFFLRL